MGACSIHHSTHDVQHPLPAARGSSASCHVTAPSLAAATPREAFLTQAGLESPRGLSYHAPQPTAQMEEKEAQEFRSGEERTGDAFIRTEASKVHTRLRGPKVHDEAPPCPQPSPPPVRCDLRHQQEEFQMKRRFDFPQHPRQ